MPTTESEASGDECTEDPEQSELNGLRETLMHFNLDRKLVPEKLIRSFDLPEGSERVGKFTCSLGNAMGQLHVTTYHMSV